MSFLDNLENNLKTLESQEDSRGEALRQEQARAQQKAAAAAAQSFAEELKKGPYTAELLKQSTRVGHSLRTKIHVAWLGSNLRLEARDRRLELRPTGNGVTAVYLENARELRSEPLDLKGSPEAFLRQWLDGLAAPAPELPPADE